MATKSRWRLAARRVILRTLNGLPAGAAEKARRAAVRDAYPWGERSGHPYQCWLTEVRRVLGARVGCEPDAPARDPDYRLLTYLSTPFWVVVTCEHCRTARVKLRGCLLCGPFVDSLDWLLGCDDFHALLAACRETPADPLPRLVLADWLDERGHGRLAEVFRAMSEEG